MIVERLFNQTCNRKNSSHFSVQELSFRGNAMQKAKNCKTFKLIIFQSRENKKSGVHAKFHVKHSVAIKATHTCVRSSTRWVRTRNGHKVGRTHFSLGVTYTKTLTWVLIIFFDMHWWDLNTKSFRQFSAIKNTF